MHTCHCCETTLASATSSSATARPSSTEAAQGATIQWPTPALHTQLHRRLYQVLVVFVCVCVCLRAHVCCTRCNHPVAHACIAHTMHRRLYQVLVVFVFVCVCVCVYAHVCAAQGATIQSPTPALHTQYTDVCIKC